jgi:hypothetical protein
MMVILKPWIVITQNSIGGNSQKTGERYIRPQGRISSGRLKQSLEKKKRYSIHSCQRVGSPEAIRTHIIREKKKIGAYKFAHVVR